MFATDEPERKSDKKLYRVVPEVGVEAFGANSQIPESALASKVDYPRLLSLAREVLIAIGEDPDREGLVETPRRWASWWREFIEYDPGKVATVFSSSQTDQLIVVSNLQVYSLCEHHLLPFRANIAIGYLSGDKLLGLSKFGRIAEKHAHKLQLQERLVEEIADEVQALAGTDNVAVTATGDHLCMTMRGVRQGDALMTSSVIRGIFRAEPAIRAEFFSLVHNADTHRFP